MEITTYTKTSFTFTVGEEKHTIFKKYVVLIKQNKKGSNIYVEGFEEPFFVNVEFDLLKTNLNID